MISIASSFSGCIANLSERALLKIGFLLNIGFNLQEV